MKTYHTSVCLSALLVLSTTSTSLAGGAESVKAYREDEASYPSPPMLRSLNEEEGDLRLIWNGRPNQSRGILQVYLNGFWGTVCDDDFSNTNAQVACRQLGFSSGGSSYAVSRAFFGEGIGPIWLDNVACSGSESRLVDCPNNGPGVANCGHHEDVGLVCSNDDSATEGEIRLVDGPSDREGRLQIFHDGVWGTVCDDDFTNTNANVICRELGYAAGGYGVGNAGYGQGADPTWLDNVMCSGSEASLADCPSDGWGVENCGHHEDVGIVCLETTPSEGDIQLVNGPNNKEGRLQVFHDGIWGTVCDDDFSNVNSNILCRQLGFKGGYAAGDAPYGPGVDPTWLDNVLCTGSETSILDCPSDGWGEENCGHSEDIGIVCSNDVFSEGQVQLVNGTGPHEGRLQIYHDGVWGTVCDDDFTNANANVVCRQLGYAGGHGTSKAPFGYGADPIWLDSVDCTGNEASLSDCASAGWGEENCGHSEDVGIFCSDETFSEGDLQLVNGTAGPHEGRLQIYHEGVWGTVCDDSFSDKAAQVACRSLGYEVGIWVDSAHPFGMGVDPTWLDDVVCVGTEASLPDCANPGWGEENCGHSEDVGIRCFPMDISKEHSDGDIILVGGGSPSEGLVMVLYSNEWGGVCSSSLTQADVNVICRELGFEGGLKADSTFGALGIVETVWLNNVDCAGNEDRLSACPGTVAAAGACPVTDVAGVSCIPKEFPDPPENVASEGGGSGSSGGHTLVARPLVALIVAASMTFATLLWM